jgi:preprotein translocase subunit SecE
MNREMRRLQEAEERRRKKQDDGQTTAQRRAATMTKQQAPGAERKSFFRRVRDYLHEVRQELRKVTWPNREQMIVFTTITMITVTTLTAVIFAFDVVAKEAVLRLLELVD